MVADQFKKDVLKSKNDPSGFLNEKPKTHEDNFHYGTNSITKRDRNRLKAIGGKKKPNKRL